MLKVSIFTPTHEPSFLKTAWDSIKDQPFHEWIIVYNNGAKKIGFKDPRVKERNSPDTRGWVGPLKAYACDQATGDILLELDHDDLLMPTAVQEVINAFKDPDVGFVYSNSIDMTKDGKQAEKYSADFGWQYRKVKDHGGEELVAFPPTPQSVSRIWYAPNHLRAFRRSIYKTIGGYSTEMRVLDDQDLMSRLYCVTKFKHIDKPLYIYRSTGKNASLVHNKEIQDNVYTVYHKHIEAMVDKWADDQGFPKIELGGRMYSRPGYMTVDLKDADKVFDLNKKWKLETSSVGVLRANDVFEHLKNPIHVMKEAQRVLVPGGWLMCKVPSTDGRGAFQDPTHVSFWNENSFLYYTDRQWAQYIDTPVRFQSVALYTGAKDVNQVCWTHAHLINLKGDYRPPGLVKV